MNARKHNMTEMGEVDGVPAETDYSQFHNMNALAERLCANESGQEWRIKRLEERGSAKIGG